MADGARSFLGMTHNPFVDPQEGFFDRGGRKNNLDRLRHLSEWSRRILLVTGPEGVGKTTLFRELAASLEPRVKAARINAALVSTGREVLSAVAQGFGLAAPADANSQALRFSLLEDVERQSAADRLCLTLIDDAQLLDNKALDELIVLTHESAMHLVLFGEVRMVPVVERAASAKGVGWQEIRLSGYSDADARDYLEWRFQQARYRGRIPFTNHEVKDLVRLSEGLPGRMNRMANVLLSKLESGEVDPNPGFPRLHGAILVLVVAVMGLLYVLVGPDDGPALPVQREAIILSQAQDPARDLEIAADGSAEADRSSMASGNTPALIEAPAQPDAIRPDAGERAESDLEPAESSSESEPEKQPAPEPGPEATPEPTPQPAQAAAPETVTDPASAAQPEAVARPAPPSSGESGARDTRWLLSQNPAYFTLQLVTVSSAERAQTFVQAQREPQEFTVYELQREGRTLHVVLYGLFSSREAAQTAADRLPAEVGDIQPWIREIGQVQGAARISASR